jgi:hypothetical protein
MENVSAGVVIERIEQVLGGGPSAAQRASFTDA